MATHGPVAWFRPPGIDLWIAFANTMVMSHGTPTDRLDSRSAIGRWASGAGLGSTSAFETRWERTKDAGFRQLRDHRDRLRSMLETADARILRQELPGPANAMLGAQPTWRRFEEGRLEVGVDDRSLLAVLPLVGLSIVDFIQRGNAQRVRQCGSDDCILYFLDETRPGNRRWCDGSGCGNRARVRRHASRLSE